MRTRSLILIVVGIILGILALTVLGSWWYLMSQKEPVTEQGNGNTQQGTGTQQTQIIPGDANAVSVRVVERRQDNNVTVTDGVLAAVYLSETGEVAYLTSARSGPYLYQGNGKSIALVPGEPFEQMTGLQAMLDTGASVPTVLVEQGRGAVSLVTSDGFRRDFERYEQMRFGGSAQTLIALEQLEDQLFRIVRVDPEDALIDPGEIVRIGHKDLIDVELVGASDRGVFVVTTETSGRRLELITLADGTRKTLLENVQTVSVSPSGHFAIANNKEGPATFTNLVSDEGASKRVVLPSDAAPFYAWSPDERSLFVLVGSAAPETGDETYDVETGFVGKTLWEVVLDKGDKKEVASLPTGDTVTGAFFYDPVRKILVLRDVVNGALVLVGVGGGA